jgi:hypothetical protein
MNNLCKFAPDCNRNICTEEKYKLNEMETSLREFISEILTPFNERVTTLENENRSCQEQQIISKDML